MEREQARQAIRNSWREILQTMTVPAKTKVNGETSYVCPICGHGKNGDGMTYNPRSRDKCSLSCFGCGFGGDIIDLQMKVSGADYNAALSLLAQQINITIDSYAPDNVRAAVDSGRVKAPTPTQEAASHEAEPLDPPNYRDYYAACRQRIHDPAAVAYLSNRGISVETASAYWVGFDPDADPAQSGHKCPRIIIPTSTTHYIGRSIDPNTPKQFAKMNNKGGTPGIFNSKAIYSEGTDCVFVVEGAFDALSIIEAGAPAIALNSTSNVGKLLDLLREHRPSATLVLCLDNDRAGNKAYTEIREELQRLNISHITADILGGCKDPNEALTTNRAAFTDAIERAQHQTAARPDSVAHYIDHIMSGEIARFRDVKQTGFANLDAEAHGLYPGLYTVAAISSLGKTTFCHQMADQLAAAGNDVLFFSLEQSRLELVSKSIARKTAQADKENAVTSLSIRRGWLPPQALAAAEQYKEEVQDRMNIVEGNFACNISFIGDYIRQYVRRTGTRPVVFIDYLQVIQPDRNERLQTTRETVDYSVVELKRISRELDLTVFVICSVNRSNYLTPIDFESLKESGGIEYTCDVVWGLQFQCLNDELFNGDKKIKEKRERIKEAKASSPRKIELVCLKNRYGVASFSCYFNYYPANDLFEPCDEAELDFSRIVGVDSKWRGEYKRV